MKEENSLYDCMHGWAQVLFDCGIAYLADFAGLVALFFLFGLLLFPFYVVYWLFT